MTVSVVSVLFLLTGFLAVRKISAEVFPLNMAENSVDDFFENCSRAMLELVESKYTKYEKEHTPGFKNAWKVSLSKAKNGQLEKKQAAAIYMYTRDPNCSVDCTYREFNKATRDGKQEYKSGRFQFYTLFFYLTVAIQQLKPNPQECVTVYRRTNVTFKTDVHNHTMRFGTFTSTSHLKNLTDFGEESCFEVYTCYGADIEQYSALTYQKEVLIPPYEIFHVTAIEQNTWCKVVYTLKSDGMMSSLNCEKVISSSAAAEPSFFIAVLLFTAVWVNK
ncbi:NAD(P)(+)--arginine ADP-ribosyltransferase 2-like [Astyanax mexicanus]|uniref:NAD(P)(+)--arginine ADP-ribosyltransferase 2-like n=1 Tax=Astyanax mexicanus TaxID=7994 RepID=UPI0020CB2583|nr:NAD(P)(+)--arginine ADP-ribosyltransferase 2-like [Astyanax mexicanus]